MIFYFGKTGPSKLELIKLHKIVPELKSFKITSIYKNLKGHSIYRTQEKYGNIESRRLFEQASALGLNVDLESKQVGGYLPISKDNCVLIIEDDNLANRVVGKMIEAGVEVVEIHVD